MKHLKTINELFKSTYLSAAAKLKDRHEERAEELIKHAAEIGQDTPHERICPFRFIFPGSLENEFYSIQSVEVKEQNADWHIPIYINFKSNYGNSRSMELKFDLFAPVIAKQRNPEQLRRHLTSQDDNFHFELNVKSDTGFTHPDSATARKNANALWKFFLEYWEDELSEKYPDYILSNFRVNNLYFSKKQR